MLSSIVNSLRGGVSTSLTILGDDSINDGDEAIKLLGQLVAEAVPNCQVRYRYWDATNLRYAQQFDSDIFGRDDRAARRNIRFPGGASGRPRVRPQAQLAGIVGDFDIAMPIAPEATWAVASNQQLIANWGGQLSGGAKGRGLMFGLKANGANYAFLQLSISTDGNNQVDIPSTMPIPTPNPLPQTPQPLWVRVTRVASTGVVTFYTGSDGVSWTQLGAVVTSTTGNLYATTEDWTLGGRGTSTELFVGRIYGLRMKNSLAANTPVMNTGPIESWQSRNDTSDTSTIEGAPTLYLHNASANQQSVGAGSFDATRVPLMVEPFDNGAVGIMGNSANDNGATWAGIPGHKVALDTVLALVRARAPLLETFVLTGVPFILPRPPLRRDPQARRGAWLPIWAQLNGLQCVDTYSAFLSGSGGTPATLMNGFNKAQPAVQDGSTMSAEGTRLYADTILRALLARP